MNLMNPMNPALTEGHVQEAARRALELDPAHYWTHGRIALVLERQDSWEEALVEFDQAGVPLRSAYTRASTGRVADVRRIIDSSLARPEGEQDAYHLAGAYAGLGQPDEAIRWLTVALRQRADDVVYMKVDPRLDSLRDAGLRGIARRRRLVAATRHQNPIKTPNWGPIASISGFRSRPARPPFETCAHRMDASRCTPRRRVTTAPPPPSAR